LCLREHVRANLLWLCVGGTCVRRCIRASPGVRVCALVRVRLFA
jgi:hypothetical protein